MELSPWASVQKRPYIVSGDRLGKPLAYGRVENMPRPQEAQIRAELGRFVAHADGGKKKNPPVAQSKMIDLSRYTRAARGLRGGYFNHPQTIRTAVRERIRSDLRHVRPRRNAKTWEIDVMNTRLNSGAAMRVSGRGTARANAMFAR